MPPNSTHPSQLRPEQLPVPAHQLHHWTHFAGLYAAEHVAATEFVIGATFARICSESAAKLPKFLMPTLRDNLANDGPIQHATFILAAWCYYSDRQTNERDEALNIMDAQSAALHEAAKGTTKDWTAFLRQPELFGDLVEHPHFVEAYTELVQRVYAAGDVRGVMSGLE